jgi:predicted nucleic acid-binding Zn ribbon protein
VWAHWREIVGPSIADHADPTSLRQGVLRVRADSPAWATEIGYLGTEIKTRINAAVGSTLVDEVRVWIGARVERKDRRPPDEGRTRPRPRAASDDPEAALERAKKAWSRTVERGSDEGPRRGPENQEKRR